MQRRDVTLAILALGVTQVIGYGGLYYAFAVLAPLITQDFGWSSGWTYGGFSLGLLAGGLVAPLAGRAIDRYGAPPMMAIGSGLAALALVGLAFSETLLTYLAAIIAIEMVATLVLYDAAFTLLTQVAGRDARAAITKLTLIGGFASTLFWPLTTWLASFLDWRSVYLVYAGLCLFVCMPLHAALRAGVRRARLDEKTTNGVQKAGGGSDTAPLPPNERRRAFWLVAIFLATGGFVVSVLSVHMLSILQELGYAAVVATLIGMLQGPSQVGARLIEFVFARRIAPRTTAIVSAALMPLGLAALGLVALGPAAGVAFAIAYGAGLGLNSIVRGTLPLALFGPIGYGSTMGRLAAPGLLVKSSAPLAFALLQDAAGLAVALAFLFLVAIASLVAVLLVPRPR